MSIINLLISRMNTFKILNTNLKNYNFIVLRERWREHARETNGKGLLHDSMNNLGLFFNLKILYSLLDKNSS